MTGPYCPHLLHGRLPLPNFLTFFAFSFAINLGLPDLDSEPFGNELHGLFFGYPVRLPDPRGSYPSSFDPVAWTFQCTDNVHSENSQLRNILGSWNLDVFLDSEREVAVVVEALTFQRIT